MTTVEKTAKKMPLAMRGHIAARNYLVRNGLRIVEDGYSCGQGEVDFVAMDGENCMCFVEVMTRFAHSSDPQFPNEAVDRQAPPPRRHSDELSDEQRISHEHPHQVRHNLDCGLGRRQGCPPLSQERPGSCLGSPIPAGRARISARPAHRTTKEQDELAKAKSAAKAEAYELAAFELKHNCDY